MLHPSCCTTERPFHNVIKCRKAAMLPATSEIMLPTTGNKGGVCEMYPSLMRSRRRCSVSTWRWPVGSLLILATLSGGSFVSSWPTGLWQLCLPPASASSSLHAKCSWLRASLWVPAFASSLHLDHIIALMHLVVHHHRRHTFSKPGPYTCPVLSFSSISGLSFTLCSDLTQFACKAFVCQATARKRS